MKENEHKNHEKLKNEEPQHTKIQESLDSKDKIFDPTEYDNNLDINENQVNVQLKDTLETMENPKSSGLNPNIQYQDQKATNTKKWSALEFHWFTNVFFILRLSFEWLSPLLCLGMIKPLDMDDVPKLPKHYTAEKVVSDFEKIWEKYKHRKGGAFLAVTHLTFWRFLLAGVCAFLMRASDMAVPIIFHQFLLILENPDSSIEWQGYVFISVLFIAKTLYVYFLQWHLHLSSSTGFIIRTALMGAMYKKTLRIRNPPARLMNLISSDVTKIDLSYQFFHFSWSIIVTLAIGFTTVFILIGPAAIAGLVVIALLVPLQIITSKLLSKVRVQSLLFTDKRIQAIKEMLAGMQIIKFYSWEQSMFDKILKSRKHELKYIKRSVYIKSFLAATLSTAPIVISVATFTTYVLLGNTLKASVIFPTIATFSAIRLPLGFVLFIIAQSVEALVSMKRVGEYLNTPEIKNHIDLEKDEDYAIQFENVNCVWDKLGKATNIEEELNPETTLLDHENIPEGIEISKGENFNDIVDNHDETRENLSSKKNEGTKRADDIDDGEAHNFGLHNMSIKIKHKSTVAIIGQVGSGKSSLVNAMIGEMPLVDGKIKHSDLISYSSQQTFITNATIRENILFGAPLDKERYEEAILNSELLHDLESLEFGDNTEIGEKGVNLSGGQKMRLAIARVIYNEAPIVIMDCPLAALDAHVGRRVFEHCILEYLKDRTVILVTHQLQYIQHFDHIILMNNGKIAEQGSFEQLMGLEGEVYTLVERFNESLQDEDVEIIDGDVESEEELNEIEYKNDEIEISHEESDGEDEANDDEKGRIITKEDRQRGAVSLKVIWHFIKAMGHLPVLFLMIVLYILAQLGALSIDLFISLWSENKTGLSNTYHNLAVYASVGLVTAILTTLRDILLFQFVLLASKNLHKHALKRIIYTTMSYLHSQPLGRMINRFSNDVSLIDTNLGDSISRTFNFLFIALGIFSLIIATTYGIALIPLIPALIIYLLLTHIFRVTTRELKRLDSISKSPIVAHFNESLDGVSTIRAYRQQNSFVARNQKTMTYNIGAFYLSMATQRWLNVRLAFVGDILTLVCGIAALNLRRVSFFSTTLLSLAYTYSLDITRAMSWFIRNSSLTEIQFNAVERLDYYASHHIPNETGFPPPKRVIGHIPPKLTTTESSEELNISKMEGEQLASSIFPNGEIEWCGYSTKYRVNLPRVLKRISLKVNPREKIGIVGRTGSGKSTTMLGLYRIIEPCQGKILIDGQDISMLPLHVLRRGLSIIPQDPVLFEGTIRSNLDPFFEFTNAKLQQTLKDAHLNKKYKPETVVREGGSNFSVGERQLLCLARALLRNAQIFILDEATSNVDMDTDRLIQDTIRTKFSHCTVLTIAHRLNTVIDNDRILVLSNGRIAEFDSPTNLLKNSESIFYELVKETGPDNATFLFSQCGISPPKF